MSYTLTSEPNQVQRDADKAHIPFADGNRDYEDYKAWLAAGNTPTPPGGTKKAGKAGARKHG